VCQPVALATGQTTPSWLVSNSQTVFWIDETQSPQIAAANVDGTVFSGSLPYVSASADEPTYGFAVFGTGSQMFIDWIDSVPGNINSYGPVGGTVLPSTNIIYSFGSSYGVNGVVSDSTNMYWGDSLGVDAISESGSMKAITTPLIPTKSGVEYMAIDSANAYWIDANGGDGTLTISGAPLKQGATPTLLVPLSSVIILPVPIAANPAGVYFLGQSNGGFGLFGAPLNTTTTTPTLLSGSGTPIALATDANALYWVDSASGGVYRRANGSSSAVTKVATSQSFSAYVGYVCNLVVDAKAIYWGTNDSVMAVAKSAGE